MGAIGMENLISTRLAMSQHLVKEEIEDNGKITQFTYHPGTDLVASKFVVYDGKILIRNFFDYDENAVLVKKIVDNGSTSDKDNLTDVTERRFTYTIPRTKFPFGLPDQIDEKYLDMSDGQEVLIKRIRIKYSRFGWIRKKKIYDSNGELAYVLKWKYDDNGNVVEEANALEEIVTRKYDRNNNLIVESKPSQNRTVIHLYDKAKRRTETEEIHSDQLKLKTVFHYNHKSNLEREVNPFGNEKKIVYDEFGRIKSVSYPDLIDENGGCQSCTVTHCYDIAGNVISTTDQKNNITTKKL